MVQKNLKMFHNEENRRKSFNEIHKNDIESIMSSDKHIRNYRS